MPKNELITEVKRLKKKPKRLDIILPPKSHVAIEELESLISQNPQTTFNVKLPDGSYVKYETVHRRKPR